MGGIINLLRDPFWQGIGVIFAIVFGFLGFYYNGKNKLWLYVAGCVLIFILGLTAGTAIQAVAAQTTANSPIPIAIDSTKDWQPTGVTLKKGDIVDVRVEGGKWSTYSWDIPDSILKAVNKGFEEQSYPQGEGLRLYMHKETSGNGDKSRDCINCPIPVSESNLGCLIARIGEARPFVIGQERTFVSADAGLLQFRINDSTNEGLLNDNAGYLAVTVKKRMDKQ